MSGPEERRSAERDPDAGTPQAHVHIPKWSPWLWVVPVIAIFFIGWLVVRYGIFGGGDITVRFADARGLERYSSVRFRGAKVGTVQKITIDKNLGQVVVRISMDSTMNHALNKGTRFWIVEPGLEGGGLGGLLSGTYIGIAPGEGDQTSEFVGQEDAPVLFPAEAGRTFILESRGLGSVAVGGPVQYHGLRVGSILGSEYDAAHGITFVHAFVAKRFENEVRQGTRFWRGGGLNLSLGGSGITSGGTSISSLLNAPIAFYTPEFLAGAPAAEKTHFELYDSQSMAEAASDGPQLTYLTYFRGPVKGLTAGTPVQMNGVEVGRVRDVRLRYVPASAALESPVTLEIDPRKLELPVTQSTTREELRGTMNDVLQKLVQKGMRASLATSLVLPGASAVTLDMTGAPGSAHLVLTSDPPIIPSAAGGSGLEGALSAVNDVAARIRNLPIEQILGHLNSASQKVDALVSDPALHESLQHLNATLADVQKVAAAARENAGPITKSVRNAASSAEAAAKTLNENVAPIAKSLRSAADSADVAAKRASQLVGTSQYQNRDLGTLIKELTEAAEAVRALASYLTENPDALLKGRGK
ncbi:MAG: paraquat-inducible protein [Thermoanaerobaculia bacterium]|jgi:paraquat-inducible protein B|nr:paraquat-inducible protein [Thermoanaerobaculia bacterium]